MSNHIECNYYYYNKDIEISNKYSKLYVLLEIVSRRLHNINNAIIIQKISEFISNYSIRSITKDENNIYYIVFDSHIYIQDLHIYSKSNHDICMIIKKTIYNNIMKNGKKIFNNLTCVDNSIKNKLYYEPIILEILNKNYCFIFNNIIFLNVSKGNEYLYNKILNFLVNLHKSNISLCLYKIKYM